MPALFFSKIEGWDFLDAFYFTIITLTTIGFGDLTPTAEFEGQTQNNWKLPGRIFHSNVF